MAFFKMRNIGTIIVLLFLALIGYLKDPAHILRDESILLLIGFLRYIDPLFEYLDKLVTRLSPHHSDRRTTSRFKCPNGNLFRLANPETGKGYACELIDYGTDSIGLKYFETSIDDIPVGQFVRLNPPNTLLTGVFHLAVPLTRKTLQVLRHDPEEHTIGLRIVSEKELRESLLIKT